MTQIKLEKIVNNLAIDTSTKLSEITSLLMHQKESRSYRAVSPTNTLRHALSSQNIAVSQINYSSDEECKIPYQRSDDRHDNRSGYRTVQFIDEVQDM
jgi:hypothetical protein